jgi:hypothetical protein
MLDVNCNDEVLIRWVGGLERLGRDIDNSTYRDMNSKALHGLLISMVDVESVLSLKGSLGQSNNVIGNGDIRERYRRRALHVVKCIINHIKCNEANELAI